MTTTNYRAALYDTPLSERDAYLVALGAQTLTGWPTTYLPIPDSESWAVAAFKPPEWAEDFLLAVQRHEGNLVIVAQGKVTRDPQAESGITHQIGRFWSTSSEVRLLALDPAMPRLNEGDEFTDMPIGIIYRIKPKSEEGTS